MAIRGLQLEMAASGRICVPVGGGSYGSKKVDIHHPTMVINGVIYNPYKWPQINQWITGVKFHFTLLLGDIIPCITG